ncbi:MAG TPA: M48 family metallopeptidase [Halomicronema sp.]
MLNPLSLIPTSRRRWFYALVSTFVALGLITTSANPTKAISIGDIIRGGIQVIQGVQIANMSDEDEVEFGSQIDAELRQSEIRILRDRELNNYINQIGQRLAANSDRPNIPYTFQIVRDNNINAFATAGGFVYINSGLIAAADNEAQLASVMAHEIGHINNKHVLRSIKQAAIEQGIVTAAGMDRSTAVGLGVQLALNLPRSRNYEFEADEFGLNTLVNSGYAPIGMVQFFNKLLEKGGGSMPTFLSSHPNTADRIASIEQALDPAIANKGDGLDTVAYKSKIRSLIGRY